MVTARMGEVEPASRDLLATLQQPDFYSERPQSVELRETHISWVLLTDRYAYKLKKPVRFEFLDFSTLALRRAACEAELRLNRRLAPEIYLDVLALVRSPQGELRLVSTTGGTASLSGDDTIVDYLVKMRRLPDHSALDQLIAHHQVTTAHIDRLARRLVDFYRQQPPVSLACDQYRRAIAAHVAANRAELLDARHELCATVVARIHAAQQRLLAIHAPWWDARVCDGRVVDGHGDLRPEHVYFNGQVVIIDALEFSAELRQVDVLDELSFLAMECGVLGAPTIGDQILQRYQNELDDHPPEALRRFYESYRAMVRAKVNALRTLQLSGPARASARQATQRYLDWADERLGRWLPAAVIVVSGLSGTGKSVIAQAVTERYQGVLLSTDELRRERASATPPTASYGEQRYSPQGRDAVYEKLLERAERALDAHRLIILDGTFLRAPWLAAARQLATHHQAEFLLIRCECPLAVARERVAQRAARGDSASEITVEQLERQQAERPTDWDQWPHLRLDTTQSLPDLLATIDARCRLWSHEDAR